MTEDHTQNQEHSFFPYELILSGKHIFSFFLAGLHFSALV